MKKFYVTKKSEFSHEVKSLRKILSEKLNLDFSNLQIVDAYYINTDDENIVKRIQDDVIGDHYVNEFYNDYKFEHSFIGKITNNGQFDIRVDALNSVCKLENIVVDGIKFVKFYDFGIDLDVETMKDLDNLLINKVEASAFDESMLNFNDYEIKDLNVVYVDNFKNKTDEELKQLTNEFNLSLSFENIKYIQEYKKTENTELTIDELLAIDAYWSDHCRHSTFNTPLTNVDVENTDIKAQLSLLSADLKKYNKELTLMNVATINSRKSKEKLSDVVFSKEINCCLVNRELSDGEYTISFKNETHNHPTQIEPFGGAATCLGGAIRDILDMRSYTYQGYRLTGSANLDRKNPDGYENRLTQEQVSTTAAKGFSAYGNQIGIPTNYIHEYYHDSYLTKRMELGAVLGVCKSESLKFDEPANGDLLLVIGGSTGRDGIGGATGSSKEQDLEKLDEASAQVQKGNAPQERKLQRLFRNESFVQKLKRVNDFGAGGAFVALGELSDSIEVDLSKMPLKYKGLRTHEILISESQERMSLVIDKENLNEVLNYCKLENVNASVVGKVTNSGYKVFKYNDLQTVKLKNEWLETNGVFDRAQAKITNYKNNNLDMSITLDNIKNHLSKFEHQLQKGLDQMFDNSVTATTALASFGGKNQMTKSTASVHYIPTNDSSNENVSIITHGFDPYIFEQNPYLGGVNALVSTLTKQVSLGANYRDVRFSMQEYFPTCNNEEKWGNVLSALLGTYKVFNKFENGAIGGKDSMSGSYLDDDIVDTLISFGFNTMKTEKVISNEFKDNSKYVYLLSTNRDGFDIDLDSLISTFKKFEKLTLNKNILSASEVEQGGIFATISNACLGNEIGMDILRKNNLFDKQYGNIIFSTDEEIDDKNLELIAIRNNDSIISIDDLSISLDEIKSLMTNTLLPYYPINFNKESSDEYKITTNYSPEKQYFDKVVDKVNVLIPYFTGSNSEDDLKRAFEENGATVKQILINDSSEEAISKSISKFVELMENTHILVFPGGFSYFDEPDGSGKYIASFIQNMKVKNSITSHLDEKKLILGICNGFQALVKAGIVVGEQKGNLESILDRNELNEHIATYVNTKLITNKSPWLQDLDSEKIYKLPISHGEGNFRASSKVIKKLQEKNQIAFTYCDENGKILNNTSVNKNGSTLNIEGLISEDGLVLGKMAHSERVTKDGILNAKDVNYQNIFGSAINYFKGE